MGEFTDALFFFGCLGVSGVFGGLIGNDCAMLSGRYIRDTDKVQSGYVVPANLEFKLQDLDNNGTKEVLLTYGGKPYLLKENEQGQPVVLPYEIKVVSP